MPITTLPPVDPTAWSTQIRQLHLDNLFFGDEFPGGLKAIYFGNMIFSQVVSRGSYTHAALTFLCHQHSRTYDINAYAYTHATCLHSRIYAYAHARSPSPLPPLTSQSKCVHFAEYAASLHCYT